MSELSERGFLESRSQELGRSTRQCRLLKGSGNGSRRSPGFGRLHSTQGNSLPGTAVSSLSSSNSRSFADRRVFRWTTRACPREQGGSCGWRPPCRKEKEPRRVSEKSFF